MSETIQDKQLIRKLEAELLEQMIVKARTDFYTFVKLMAPTVLPDKFVDGLHIHIICRKLQEVAESVIDTTKDPMRLQIMVPPRSMKSRIASNLFPAWCLGRQPNWGFLAIGADFEFAVDNFGRPTKDIIDSPQYQVIFPKTYLKKDVKSAGRWATTKKGMFVAKGAGQNIAGRSAHITLCDDIITEQTNDVERRKINSWYQKGLRTRLLPRGAEIIINTRWFVEDISGYMLKVDKDSARPWEVIKIPAILTEEASKFLRQEVAEDDPRFMEGTSFWPEFWPTKLLLEKKQTMDPVEWAALYQQEPILLEGGIVKREDFQIWDSPEPPKCKYIIVSMDTALSQKEVANYSAFTVWGIFSNIVETFDKIPIAQESMILLSAGKGKWDFTQLCDKCQELDKRYVPDYFIVEEASAGLMLIPELQKRSLPVLPHKPERDKTFRLQATTPYFRAKRIWIPKDKKWAEDVVQEVASFQPRLKNQQDDLTDTVSQAIIWMRDNLKIDNDAYSNRWDDEIQTQRAKTYWSGALTNQRV